MIAKIIAVVKALIKIVIMGKQLINLHYALLDKALWYLLDVSNLLCLWVVLSFQSSIYVVFFSYWRDLSEHTVLFLMCGHFFSSLFRYDMMGVRTYYIVEWWALETCQNLSLFFWCPVLFVFPFCLIFSFCYNMMSARDLLYCGIWWVKFFVHYVRIEIRINHLWVNLKCFILI